VDEVIRFTQSLYNQIELPDEFIIVDSSDEPLNTNKKVIVLIEKRGEKTELCYVSSEPGLTKQRNIGIKKAEGDILYFFDDDVILEPDFLQIMNKTFIDNPVYMGGMGTILGMPKLSVTGRLINLFRRFFLLQHDYGNGKFQKSGFPRHPYGTNKFKEVAVLGGGLTGYKKELFEEFKFDEKLTGYSFMEDVDISRRVSYRYKLFYNPAAKLEHRHGSGGRGGNIRAKKRMYMVNHRYFFFKNFYPRNKLFVVAHWWSILGLIVYSLIFESKEVTKGYFDGLKEFKKRKKELLCN
jgi:GT2 family glycosyltransferase